MTKEIKQRLDRYNTYLQSAYYCDYTRQLSRNELTDLISIYEEHFSTRFTENLNCGVCVLGLLKRLGQDYFNYEEPIKIEENEEYYGSHIDVKNDNLINNRILIPEDL